MQAVTSESTIYVAGHRGMVGSAIVRRLQKGGFKHILTRTHAELDLLDQKAVYEFLQTEKPDGTPRKLCDVSRLHSLGWRATTELKAGIRLAYESAPFFKA